MAIWFCSIKEIRLEGCGCHSPLETYTTHNTSIPFPASSVVQRFAFCGSRLVQPAALSVDPPSTVFVFAEDLCTSKTTCKSFSRNVER